MKAIALVAILILTLAGAALAFRFLSQPELYNRSAAIAFARAADLRGALPQESLAEIRRLPKYGCWRMELAGAGAERCIERYGPYGHRPLYRIGAYAELASTFLNRSAHTDQNDDALPSARLMRAVARELERADAPHAAPAIIVEGPLAPLQSTPRMMMPGAIYKAIGDDRSYRDYVARRCGNEQWCLMNASIFEGDLDGAVTAAERLPFNRGNMGQRGIYHSDRIGLLSAARALARDDLVLRLSRSIAAEAQTPPAE